MEGSVSPAPGFTRVISGDPSVDARATPPWFAVVSFEMSFPPASVLNPRIISGSDIFKVSAKIVAEVPPMVTVPSTFKLRVTFKSLVTVRSWPIFTLPPIVGLATKPIVGAEPSPVPPVTSISFAVPLTDST